jgi:hypothetical protein
MDVRKVALAALVPAALFIVLAASSCAEDTGPKPAPAPPAKAPREKPAPAAKAPEGKPAAAAPAAPVAKAQTTCPIMGNPIDKTQFVDVGAYRIYACCPACLPKIKADPQAAIAKIRANGEEPEQLPE